MKLKIKNIVLFFVLNIVCNISTFSQTPKLNNIRFIPKGENIIINYDLHGDEEGKFVIFCYLRSESDKDFRYKLKYVDGAIGDDQIVGENKEIIWYYLKEFPQKLTGDDFYFEITVDEHSSGIPWYYYLGTAVIGGTSAYLLFSNKNSEGNQTESYASFPGRP